MVNKKICKRNCEHKPTITEQNIIVFSITDGKMRRVFFGLLKACRECGKAFVRNDGLPYDKHYCFCCGAKLGNKPRNNIARKEYNLKKERLKLGVVAI